MALRSLIPVEDIRVAHVNSEDNSTTYETGVAYKAGTMVTYEGAAYVAASDIAEDDTDLPNAAPLKWGLVPNAFTSGGDDSGLASRVSALEVIVDNPDSTPTEDSTALVTSGGVYAAVAQKLQYIAILEDIDLFDFLDEAEGNRIYCGYISHVKVGTDNLETLLGVGTYARVEIAYYSPYLGILRVSSSGGEFANAYVQPSLNVINVMVIKGTGNTVVAINRPS